MTDNTSNGGGTQAEGAQSEIPGVNGKDLLAALMQMTQQAAASSSEPKLMDKVIADYMGAKIQGEHIRNYNGANLAFTHAADIAKKLGLDELHLKQITPFPSPPANNIILNQAPEPTQPENKEQSPPQQSPPQQPKGGIWDSVKKYGIPAAIALGTGGLGAAGVGSYFINQIEEATKQKQVAPEFPQEREKSDIGFNVES